MKHSNYMNYRGRCENHLGNRCTNPFELLIRHNSWLNISRSAKRRRAKQIARSNNLGRPYAVHVNLLNLGVNFRALGRFRANFHYLVTGIIFFRIGLLISHNYLFVRPLMVLTFKFLVCVD